MSTVQFCLTFYRNYRQRYIFSNVHTHEKYWKQSPVKHSDNHKSQSPMKHSDNHKSQSPVKHSDISQR